MITLMPVASLPSKKALDFIISNAGYFSSDRTIAQYNRDIWKLNEDLSDNEYII